MTQTYPPRVKRTYRIFTVDRLKLKDLTERKRKKYQAFKYMTVSMTDYKESEQLLNSQEDSSYIVRTLSIDLAISYIYVVVRFLIRSILIYTNQKISFLSML